MAVEVVRVEAVSDHGVAVALAELAVGIGNEEAGKGEDDIEDGVLLGFGRGRDDLDLGQLGRLPELLDRSLLRAEVWIAVKSRRRGAMRSPTFACLARHDNLGRLVALVNDGFEVVRGTSEDEIADDGLVAAEPSDALRNDGVPEAGLIGMDVHHAQVLGDLFAQSEPAVEPFGSYVPC
jgi:hypothetical protein